MTGKLSPEEIAEELALIETETGDLDPEEIVRRARAKRHPLHPHFPWDDQEAAHQHRLHIARTLIHRCRHVVEFHEFTYVAPVYVKDPITLFESGGYTRPESAPEYTVNRAYTLSLGYLERTQAVLAALDVPSDIDQIIRRVQRSQAAAVEYVRGATRRPAAE